MKALYIDCSMGAAGDMLTAALSELLEKPDEFVEKLNGLDIPEVKFVKEKSVKCGITGTRFSVLVHGVEENGETHSHHHDHDHDQDHHDHDQHNHHDHHDHHHDHAHTHHHSSMRDIEQIITRLNIPLKVKNDVMAVYGLIAEAESHAHGVPVAEIHFHEVGTMDAIADITAVCLLMNELSPDEVVVSPIHVGSGQVKCAHGILPVPAPATAYILKDVPIYGGEINGELCTPTGAALLKHFASRFGNIPIMKTRKIGYGMGKKDFPAANCVRAFLGDICDIEDKTDTVFELSCNVDDMTAEEIGFAAERLFEGGANEVYTVPIGMKKSRPGVLLRVMCKEQDREKLISLIFKHTSTIGIREAVTRRYILDRKTEIVNTPFGEVRRKISEGYGVTRSKYEYDDIARIAREKDLSPSEVKKQLEEIYKK